MKVGVAELPLHEGKVPTWMAKLMKRLAKALVEVIVEEYGPGELIKRLSSPVWFQAFNNAIGMDWDSSGSTTVTTAILRQVFDEHPELGIVGAGGKGRLALETPRELEAKLERIGAKTKIIEKVKLASRLAAKTDNVLLQDGYQLYHHTVFVAENGLWTVIQQGMNTSLRLARRYHWLCPRTGEVTLEPHTGVVSVRRERTVLDLTSRLSIKARRVIVDIAQEPPRKQLNLVYEAYRILKGLKPLTLWIRGAENERTRISREAIEFYAPQPTPPTRIGKVLERLFESQPKTIEELVLVTGVGPSTIRSLALVSELIYGAEASHRDPAVDDPFKYAYIVGGKDGVPFAFNPKLAEEVVNFLEEAVERAKLGDKFKLRLLRNLRNLLSNRQPSSR